MSRQVPLITKKEIIYRRSFIDDHNERFDHVMRNPTDYHPRKLEPERPQNVVYHHTYNSDVVSDFQLAKINKKLDQIIDILRSPAGKKSVEEHVNVDTGREGQTRQYKEFCERLGKLENELIGKGQVAPPLYDEITTLTNNVRELAKVQEDLRLKISESHIAAEDIDELLKVINETRRDMEEKIGNIKQLSDGNYIHLEDKLDGYLRNQHGIQMQVDHLMNLLANDASRPQSSVGTASAYEKQSLSRSSSKSSSIKHTLVLPTSRSPPPKPPSVVSYTSSSPRTEKSASRKSATSSHTIESTMSSRKMPPPPAQLAVQPTAKSHPPLAPKKPVRTMTFEVLERTKSIETINELAKEAVASTATSSSGSFIAPLPINERRNSQPANIFLTKKY